MIVGYFRAIVKINLLILLTFVIPCFSNESWVDDLTLDEKVGQLLIVHFNGLEPNEEAKYLIQTVHVGGIIYYNWANGLTSAQQVRALSHGLQGFCQQNRKPIPLLIALDQEGGRVVRLKNGFSPLPSNGAVGAVGDPDLAGKLAFLAGQEMRAVGVNLNLAPVVDINSNPGHSFIGDRSYGDSPTQVIAFARKAVEGYKAAGMISALKHFPGHGDVEVDSHIDLPVINKTLEELEGCELRPFFELGAYSEVIMTAHLMVPAIDPVHCATLSKKTLNFLREKIKFTGVIISDSLIMEGLLKNGLSIDDAAIQAINAGCDLLILGGKYLNGMDRSLELSVCDVGRIHAALVNAVKMGVISELRLNDAVQRILKLKSKHDIYQMK